MILENHSYRVHTRHDHLYRVVHIYFVRIAVSYRTVFVSSSNRTGLYEVFSLFCTGYTGPFVGSYFSICVTGFVFVPGLLLAS